MHKLTVNVEGEVYIPDAAYKLCFQAPFSPHVFFNGAALEYDADTRELTMTPALYRHGENSAIFPYTRGYGMRIKRFLNAQGVTLVKGFKTKFEERGECVAVVVPEDSIQKEDN